MISCMSVEKELACSRAHIRSPLPTYSDDMNQLREDREQERKDK
jgi:hypothetical protein